MGGLDAQPGIVGHLAFQLTGAPPGVPGEQAQVLDARRQLLGAPAQVTPEFTAQPVQLMATTAFADRKTEKQLTLLDSASQPVRIQLEPEIKAVMLEMLVNNFFGADVPYERITGRYVPALERVIDHIVRDTVINRLGIPTFTFESILKDVVIFNFVLDKPLVLAVRGLRIDGFSPTCR